MRTEGPGFAVEGGDVVDLAHAVLHFDGGEEVLVAAQAGLFEDVDPLVKELLPAVLDGGGGRAG